MAIIDLSFEIGISMSEIVTEIFSSHTWTTLCIQYLSDDEHRSRKLCLFIKVTISNMFNSNYCMLSKLHVFIFNKALLIYFDSI